MPAVRASSCLALIAVAAAAVGCGSDAKRDTRADRREIRSVAARSFTAKSPRVECESYTERLVREIYRSPAGCRMAARPSTLEPRTLVVTRVRVDGDDGWAQVTGYGNGHNGLEGRMKLHEDDGDWRIDELGLDLLRSTLVTGLKGPAFADERAFSLGGTRACVGERLERMPAARVRAVAYDSLRAAESSGVAFNEQVVRPCLPATREGRALLRKEFEAGVADGGREQGQSPTERRCVRGALRRSLSSREIAVDVIRPAAELSPQISRAIDKATQACT